MITKDMHSTVDNSKRTQQIKKVLIVTLLLNLTVSIAKILYGYWSDSISIISDGYHSMFDSISNVVGLIGISFSSLPPDKCHPYGHRKIETLMTIFIGLIMLFVCFEILTNAYEALFKNQYANIDFTSLIIMLITLCINIFVVYYEKDMAKKLQSEFLLADSNHTLADIYVTLGILFGLVVYLLGFKMADAVAGIVVGAIVAYTSVKIIKEASDILIDINRLDTAVIRDIVCKVEGVMHCHEIRSRGVQKNVFIDLHVLVDPTLTVEDAHRIAHKVEEMIKMNIPEIVDVVVHVEPYEDK